MTSIDEAPDDSGQEYDWGLAPSHLQTRRQLRAAGLGPNRQSVAALMVGKSKGRRLIAHLFDVRKAVPKRVPTPAQLDAIRKATVEHQARAAERHGITRAELTESTALAPGWEHTPTPKKGNPMPDNEVAKVAVDSTLDIHLRASELERAVEQAREVGREGEELRAEHALDEHLREYRAELSNDSYWNTHYAEIDRADNPGIAPHGHNQRVAFLLATVAAYQARVDDAALAQAVDNARTEGEEAVEALRARYAQDQAAAEARMQSIPWHNPAATVAVFSDALLWAGNSEIAQEALNELTGRYAARWGVVVNPETFTVSIDPGFDAQAAQDRADAERRWQRESAVLEAISAMPLRAAAKSQVAEAITAWRGQIDPADPGAGLLVTRREQLAVDLAASTLSRNDRASVEFVVDYLRGNTTGHDLLGSPVFVDPGEEARGRIRRVLDVFLDNPNAGPFVGEEIAVMTAEDQAKVREVGTKIAHREPADLNIWPGYVDRYEIREQLIDYVADTFELRAEADHLAEGNMTAEEQDGFGVFFAIPGGGHVTDDLHERITRLAEANSALRETISSGKGLAAIERVQLSQTISDIDAGRIRDRENLPELLFADERSKADAEAGRISAAAAVLSSAAREAVTERIEAAVVAVDHRNDRLRYAVTSISDSIYTVACGSRSGDLPADRKTYMDRRDRLAQALAEEKVHPDVQKDVRALVDGRARQAGEIGRAAADRTDQWTAKIDRVVAARDDQIAQRQAANAGQAAHAGRACTTQAERSTGQEHPRARTTNRGRTNSTGIS
ncbi:hypothetical protein ACWEP5_36510 [Nocardia niigatensis]